MLLFFILFDRTLFSFCEYSIILSLCILEAKKRKEAGVPKSTLQTFINFPAFSLAYYPFHCASVPKSGITWVQFLQEFVKLPASGGDTVEGGKSHFVVGRRHGGSYSFEDRLSTNSCV